MVAKICESPLAGYKYSHDTVGDNFTMPTREDPYVAKARSVALHNKRLQSRASLEH